jgi:CBS domain-containing protein
MSKLDQLKEMAMASRRQASASGYLSLDVRTAAELMVANPVSIRENATVREAIALLTDKGFSAAPVIDAAGRPIGVVSRADIVAHDRQKLDSAATIPSYYEDNQAAEQAQEPGRKGSPATKRDRTLVRDIMTPVVFSVAPDASAAKVVQEMVALKVHRLFVVDNGRVLIGVISALDVLRHLT